MILCYPQCISAVRERPGADSGGTACSLSVKEAVLRYEAVGHSQTLSATRKRRVRGDIEPIKQDIFYGKRYRVIPSSVARRLTQTDRYQREEPMLAAGREHSFGFIPRANPDRDQSFANGRRR